MRRRYLLYAVGILVLGIPAVIWCISSEDTTTPARVSVREALASQLMVSPDLLYLSMPPVDGRYPGAILVRDEFGRVLPVSFAPRPDVHPGSTFEVDAAAASSAAVLLKGQIQGAGIDASAERHLRLEISLRAGRVYERPLGELRALIAANEDAQRLMRKGRDTEVIVRAYEATCDLTVRRESQLDSQQWQKFRDASLKSGASLSKDDSLLFRGEVPSVVAFETMSVQTASTHFAPGAGELRLTPRAVSDSEEAPTMHAASRVAVGCIGSSRYPALGNLPAAASAELVEDTLGSLGFETIAAWQKAEVLSESELDTWFRDLAAAVKRARPDALLVYWAGHSVSLANGMFYLVLGTQDGDLSAQLGASDGRLGVEEEGQPLAGSNISDILDALQAVEDEAATKVQGLVPLARFYRRIEGLGVPFAILVDGCYPSAAMDRVRQDLYLTAWGDYYGPDVPDLSRYAKALERFGKRPSLRASNPVIFAAKPGKTAPVVQNPAATWGHAAGVGPLASRLYRGCLLAQTAAEPPTWAWLLGLITDQVRGMGEISTEGSITWSEWGVFDELPLVSDSSR